MKFKMKPGSETQNETKMKFVLKGKHIVKELHLGFTGDFTMGFHYGGWASLCGTGGCGPGGWTGGVDRAGTRGVEPGARTGNVDRARARVPARVPAGACLCARPRVARVRVCASLCGSVRAGRPARALKRKKIK